MVFTLGANAQVKIKDGSVTGSSTTPNTNAILELESNNKGLLYPRVSLTATNAALPGTTMVAGMVVYNTNTVAGTNGVTPGFYYSNGTVWVRLIDAPATSTAWSLTGNAGTTPGTNFIGTADDRDIVFKRNNVQAGWLNNGSLNTAFGVGAIGATGTSFAGLANTAIGVNALYSVSSSAAQANTAVGFMALYSDTSGTDNTVVGRRALQTNKAGSANVAIGSYALQNNASLTNNNNTAVGMNALQYDTSGETNTAIGSATLMNFISGNGNVALGYQAGFGQTTGDRNIMIGQFANTPNLSGNYQLNIGNAIWGTGVDSTVGNAANIGINTSAPNSSFQVTGSVSMSIHGQATNYTLTPTDNTVVFTGTTGGLTATLPSATGIAGRIYTIVNQSGGTLTISSTSSIAFLNGATNIASTAAATFQAGNTGVWYQIR